MLNDQTYLNRIIQFTGLLIVALLVSIIYAPITGLGFANPDDHWMLLKNKYVHPVAYTFDYFNTVFHRVDNIQYSPLNTLYYSLIFKINGYDPYYFHLANVLIHLLNSILLFLLAKEVLNAFQVDGALYISLIACTIWAINPINVEPVAWISGSKILISTSLTLCSLLFFIKGILNGSLRLLLLSFVVFFISFFFKEWAIITPVLFLLFYFFYNLSHTQKIKLKKRDFFILSLFFACSILFGLLTIQVNYDQREIIPPMRNYPFYQKLLLICYCFCFYFYSLALPFNLHYNYVFPFVPYGQVPIIVYLCPLAVILAVAFYYWLYKRSKNIYLHLLLFGFFFAEIFLQLQIIPMTRPALMADRFMYFPSAPLLITFAKVLYDLFKNKTGISGYISFPLVTFYAVSLISKSNALVYSWINLNLLK